MLNEILVICPCLQLQDYTKSSSGETEVKFQLTKDTLEAMLRSLTYISEQLSSMVSICFFLDNATLMSGSWKINLSGH